MYAAFGVSFYVGHAVMGRLLLVARVDRKI